MSPKIQALSEDLINKIAAGEVIERPASVVKELVENSIDAGSTRIVVSIAEGGKKLIRVADDGCGIESAELDLAIARHATSKIKNFDDLYALHTMGFRGEALASIASVAKVSLASKTEAGEPVEILVEAGLVCDRKAAAQPRGTTITVKHLFYQTPARLKFLKSNETETSHIVDTVTKLSLCHPEIGFKVLDNDRVLFDAPQTQSLYERTLQVVGRDLASYLYEFDGEIGGNRVYGLLSHPQVARSQKNLTFVFVNGRAVNDKVIHHALMEAYRDLLMRGKFPVLVMNVVIDPALVDVNVHPTKSEVRFHKSQEVHHLVHAVLREKLVSAPWLEEDCRGGVTPPVVEGSRTIASTQDSLQSWSQKYFEHGSDRAAQQRFERTSSTGMDEGRTGGETPPLRDWQRTSSRIAECAPAYGRQVQFGKTHFSQMQPIGQVWGTYILCQSGDKLVLIDQHAAHERIGFEKLIKEYQGNGIQAQKLLIAETFDLKPSDADIIKNYLDEFAKFGFEIEFFGGNTFVLKAVPVILSGKINVLNWLENLTDDIKESGALTSLKDKFNHVLATMACHGQIRANHHLVLDEIKALLNELEEYQFTDFCPHGRPVSIEVGRSEVERWFKRVL